jgi:hypothetical protein
VQHALGRFADPFVSGFITRFPTAQLRIGIVGTDTSHAIEFTRILNDAAGEDHVPGARVVAAWEGGSPDIEESVSRRDKYAAELKEKWKVRFYPDVSSLCQHVDAVLLESLDGRAHLTQAREFIAADRAAHRPRCFEPALRRLGAGAAESAKPGRNDLGTRTRRSPSKAGSVLVCNSPD